MARAFLAACLLVLLAASARAGGIDLTWGAGCWPDGAATLETFACNANTGNSRYTGSFILDQDMPLFAALIGIVDLQSASPVLPAWWQLSDQSPRGCRMGSISVSADFLSAPGGCADPWLGQAIGGLAAWQTQYSPPPPPGDVPAPNRARLKIGLILADANPLVAGREYYAFTTTIDHAKSVGTGSCAGCATPATIVLNMIETQGVDFSTYRVVERAQLTNPIANSCIFWQSPVGGGCGATPARNPTWGQVKSLYR